jgi:alpha-beta hydrolase superfamily lysophospholipase
MIKLYHHILMILILASTMINVADAKRITFQNAEDTISGHYLLPNNGKPRAIILFVHGDGPLEYDAHGYYPLIWKRLLEQGFTIFSWDKPGVGESTGDWLTQSMQQRQQEVQSAINFVQTSYEYSGAQTGLLGFSQAGWVVPAIANNNPSIGFVIGIGFAINWLEQSWYLTRAWLLKQEANASEIDAAHALHIKEINFLHQEPSYDLYLKKYGHKGDVMTEARYQFTLKNLSVDATDDYIELKQPMLLLLGDKDLNINIWNTKSVVEKLMDDEQSIQVSIIKNATHAMLNAKYFNEQTPGLSFLLKLMWQGEEAVAPEFYRVLDEWLRLQS